MQACVPTADEGSDSQLTLLLEMMNATDLFSVGIGFDGALDAYLAITDTMPNPSQHVFADLVTLHRDY